MIVFVRHGQTAVNRAGQLQGRVDAELTDLGVRQARDLAGALATLHVERVVTSPLRRASATAHAIGEALGLGVELDDRLIELDYGDWDERPFGEIERADWDAWRADPEFTPPGGESLVEVTERVAKFCDDRLDDQTVVVAVSHVSPIKAAVCLALGIDERASWRMHLDLASITRVARRPDGLMFLASYNETAHLVAVTPP